MSIWRGFGLWESIFERKFGKFENERWGDDEEDDEDDDEEGDDGEEDDGDDENENEKNKGREMHKRLPNTETILHIPKKE